MVLFDAKFYDRTRIAFNRKRFDIKYSIELFISLLVRVDC